MPYRLTSEQTHTLLSHPESGMGYQYVEAVTHDFSSLTGVALNAELFVPEGRIEKLIGRYSLSYSSLLKEAESPGLIRSVRVVPFTRMKESRLFSKAVEGSAAEADISLTEKNQVFKRFSPFRSDHRITPEGGLVTGTYGTTEQDAGQVRTGKEAVDRYALPSDDPAIYVFSIQPPGKTRVRVGRVQPAHGKRGGGVEVLFEDGSPSNTVSGPSTIPPA